MPRRLIEIDGERWEVGPSGRVTQYYKDECSIVFTRITGGAREQRVMRFSPKGSKEPDSALTELSDAELRDLCLRAQPSWTSPETGYRR